MQRFIRHTVGAEHEHHGLDLDRNRRERIGRCHLARNRRDHRHERHDGHERRGACRAAASGTAAVGRLRQSAAAPARWPAAAAGAAT